VIKSRKCFIEVYVDNQSLIIIIYIQKNIKKELDHEMEREKERERERELRVKDIKIII
jgi:hypothetical protein